MSFHSGQTFTFGEQPSASKWQYVWDNDYALADGTGISDDAIDSRHIVDGSIDFVHLGTDIAGMQKLADVTRGSTGTSVDSGTFTAKNFIRFIGFIIPTGGTLNVGIRCNADSGNNYADRSSNDGAADATGTSQAQIYTKTAVDANPQIIIGEFYNLSAQEKLIDFRSSISGTAGAGNAPNRKEGVGKWANTSSQVTRLSFEDIGGTGDIASGSRILVYGRD